MGLSAGNAYGVGGTEQVSEKEKLSLAQQEGFQATDKLYLFGIIAFHS